MRPSLARTASVAACLALSAGSVHAHQCNGKVEIRSEGASDFIDISDPDGIKQVIVTHVGPPIEYAIFDYACEASVKIPFPTNDDYETNDHNLQITDCQDPPAFEVWHVPKGGKPRRLSPFAVFLNGGQEVPRVDSPASGAAFVTLDETSGALSISGSYADLLGPEIDVHLHGPAAPDENGPIVLSLAATGGTSGSFHGNGTLTPQQVQDVLAGSSYLDVHSAAFPLGEIRAQIPVECSTGEPYCFGWGCACGNDDYSGGCANSTGAGAFLGGAGSESVTADDLVLSVAGLPANQFGIVFMGGGQTELPFGDGLQCVGAGGLGLFRYNPPQSSGGSGTITLGPGIAARSQSFPANGRIDAGETWYFQGWYRDPMGPCGSAFNLSNALAVSFAP